MGVGHAEAADAVVAPVGEVDVVVAVYGQASRDVEGGLGGRAALPAVSALLVVTGYEGDGFARVVYFTDLAAVPSGSDVEVAVSIGG